MVAFVLGELLGIWKKLDFQLNFNQYTFIISEMIKKVVIADLISNIAMYISCRVLFYESNRQIDLRNAWLFSLKAIGLPTNPNSPPPGGSRTQATLVLRGREKRGK